ncbi:hypothetical protein Hanom_Chr06g00508821 [Helianthus anomalus]
MEAVGCEAVGNRLGVNDSVGGVLKSTSSQHISSIYQALKSHHSQSRTYGTRSSD